jgi:hypothetical protein
MWPLGENFETHCTLLAYHSIRDQYKPFAIRNSSKAIIKGKHIKRITLFVNYIQNHFPINSIVPKQGPAHRLLMDICISSIRVLISTLLLQTSKL